MIASVRNRHKGVIRESLSPCSPGIFWLVGKLKMEKKTALQQYIYNLPIISVDINDCWASMNKHSFGRALLAGSEVLELRETRWLKTTVNETE